MIASEILIRAKTIYASNPSHASAFMRPDPGSFCVYTAIVEATPPSSEIRFGGDLSKAHDFLRKSMGGSPMMFNAEHSTDDVLSAWDEAIREASLWEKAS